MDKRDPFHDVLLVIALWMVFFLSGLFAVHLMPPDEPKYAYAAERMVRTGEFITPYFNCRPRFDKPPLIYWLIALSYRIFGVSDWAARIPSVAASLGVMFTIFSFSRREYGTKEALSGAAVFAGTIHAWVMGRAVAPEMVLVFFETLSIYFLYYGIEHESKRRITAGYLLMGAAFLTKGPVGVIIPLGTISLHLLFTKRFNALIRLMYLPGILLFCIVALPWYLIMATIHGNKYLEEFFLYHNIYRFTGRARQHPFGFYYYIPVLLGSLYIWLPFTPHILKSTLQKIREEKAARLFAVWIVFVLLFFTVSANKLHNYILIAYPPAAILSGAALVRRIPEPGLLAPGLIIAFAVEVAATLSIPLLIKDHYPFMFIGGITTATITAFTLRNVTTPHRVFSLLITKALVLLLVTIFYMAEYEQKIRPAETFPVLNPTREIYFYKDESEDLVFYAGRCIRTIKERNEIDDLLSRERKLLLLIREKDLGDLKGYRIEERVPYVDIRGKKRFILGIGKAEGGASLHRQASTPERPLTDR